jgi:hypothetical protein
LNVRANLKVLARDKRTNLFRLTVIKRRSFIALTPGEPSVVDAAAFAGLELPGVYPPEKIQTLN